MIRIVLILLAVCSCSDVMTPEERGIEALDVIGVENQNKSLFTAQFLAEDEYGVDLGNLHQDVVVYWTGTKCPKSENHAVIYKGECYAGRAWSCQEMYVALANDNPERTANSALLHEFGHCLSWELGEDGDADHNDSRLWAVIADARKRAIAGGW